MNRENIDAHFLGGLGFIKGCYEVYKPTNTIERCETAALALTVVTIGYVAVKAFQKAPSGS